MNTSVSVITEFSSPFDLEFETYVLKESEHFWLMKKTDHTWRRKGGGVPRTNCLSVGVLIVFFQDQNLANLATHKVWKRQFLCNCSKIVDSFCHLTLSNFAPGKNEPKTVQKRACFSIKFFDCFFFLNRRKYCQS